MISLANSLWVIPTKFWRVATKRAARWILKNKSHDLRGDQDFENSNFSWQEREIYLFFFCPKNEKLSLPQRGVLKSNSKVLLLTEVKILLNNTDLLSLSAKHCCSKSNHTVKHNFSPELEEKLREESRGETEFFSQNFDSREENLFAKSHSIEKRKRNFLQNLEFREENENFVFKILTIENISRNEHSILQLEIEKNGPFPLEIFSRSRISSMPDQR